MELTVTQGKIDGTAQEFIVALAGRATIAEAGKVKEVLLDVLGNCAGLLLDVGGVTAADTSLLQLIEAARRTAVTEGKSFTLVGGCCAAFHDAAVAAGFQTDANHESESACSTL